MTKREKLLRDTLRDTGRFVEFNYRRRHYCVRKRWDSYLWDLRDNQGNDLLHGMRFGDMWDMIEAGRI